MPFSIGNEMENKERDFKGVWIPKEIWLDKNLSWMEKLFITEIDSLDKERGCYASNGYFSEFFDITKSRCSQIISSLKNKGYISVQLLMNDKNVQERVVRILNEGIKNIKQGIKKTKEGYLENCESNNTLHNNTSNKDNIPYLEIIDYLNSKSGSHYRNTDSTRRLIHARISEGFTKEDFFKVIDNKVSSWTGSEFEKFIRPQTLFSPKFESYLNEKPIDSKTSKNDIHLAKSIFDGE